MKIDFDTIELAFYFVSGDGQFVNSAFLSRTTGQTYFISGYGDSDELPEDIENSEIYVEIPHKNDLNLGKQLVRAFASEYLPDHLDKIEMIFSRAGAYSWFKDFLSERNLLETWYRFEEENIQAALKAWCKENDIQLQEPEM